MSANPLNLLNSWFRRSSVQPAQEAVSWAPWVLLAMMALYTLGGPSLPLRLTSHAALVRQAGDLGAGSAYQYILIAISTFVLLFDLRTNLRSIGKFAPVSILIVLAWCALSVSWSPVAGVAARRVLLLAVSTIYTLYAAHRLGIRNTLTCCVVVSSVILAMDFAAVALGFGVHSFADVDGSLAGDWHGIHPHKNVAATFVGPLLVLSFWFLQKERRLRYLLLHLLTAVFLIKADSKTALIAAPLSCYGVLVLASSLRRAKIDRVWLVLVGAVVAMAAALLVLVAEIQDITLPRVTYESFTGRGQIWLQLWPYLMQHLWRGVGYGSFWEIGQASPVFYWANGFVTTVGEGHNGYFDLTLTTGLIGLSAAMWALVISPGWAALRFGGEYRGLCLALIVLSLIQNFSESAFLASDFPSWFFTLVVVAIARERTELSKRGAPVEASKRRKSSKASNRWVYGRLAESPELWRAG